MNCDNCGANPEGIYHWRLEVVARKLQKRGTDHGVIRRLWGITLHGGKGSRTVTQAANPAWNNAQLITLCEECMGTLTDVLNGYAPVVEIVPYETGREI